MPQERGPTIPELGGKSIRGPGGMGDRDRGVEGKRGLPIGPGLYIAASASLPVGPGDADRDRPDIGALIPGGDCLGPPEKC